MTAIVAGLVALVATIAALTGNLTVIIGGLKGAYERLTDTNVEVSLRDTRIVFANSNLPARLPWQTELEIEMVVEIVAEKKGEDALSDCTAEIVARGQSYIAKEDNSEETTIKFARGREQKLLTLHFYVGAYVYDKPRIRLRCGRLVTAMLPINDFEELGVEERSLKKRKR